MIDVITWCAIAGGIWFVRWLGKPYHHIPRARDKRNRREVW